MKGEWVQSASGTWHLIWSSHGLKAEGVVISWCDRTFDLDAPTKPGSQLQGWEDILHDECVRKAEEL